MSNTQAARFYKTPMLLAMMIIATGQVGVSIYLPSLPLIGDQFNVSQEQTQSIVSFFLITFGLSQLIYGPLSDSIGRRPVFFIGQIIYLLGTVVCLLSVHHFEMLVFGRFLQGLGAGSASVLGRSVLRDSYQGNHLTRALSYLSMTASILPIISPVFGAWIAYHLGWQHVFTSVLIYLTGIVLIGLKVLPETLPYPKTRFQAKVVFKNYAELITDWQVICSASYNWISYLGAVVSLSVLPFILQKGLGVSVDDYGSLMMIPACGLLIGSFALNTLQTRFSKHQLLCVCFVLMTLSGIWLLLAPVGVFHLIGAFTVLTIAQGISFPISISLLLEPHPNRVGSVSALSGSIQMCLAGFLGEFLVRHFVRNQFDLSIFYFACTLTMFLMFLSSRMRR